MPIHDLSPSMSVLERSACASTRIAAVGNVSLSVLKGHAVAESLAGFRQSVLARLSEVAASVEQARGSAANNAGTPDWPPTHVADIRREQCYCQSALFKKANPSVLSRGASLDSGLLDMPIGEAATYRFC